MLGNAHTSFTLEFTGMTAFDPPKQGEVTPNRGNAGKGRPKGSLNKNTALLKDAIIEAAIRAGNQGQLDEDDREGLIRYLTVQAVANPPAFLTLLGKIIPKNADANDRQAAHERDYEGAKVELMQKISQVFERSRDEPAEGAKH